MDEREKFFTAVLEGKRRQFNDGKGNSVSLLEALGLCLDFEVPPPDWVRHHVSVALWRYWRFDTSSLDQAFGLKHRNIAEKRRYQLTGKVTQHIWALQKDAGAALNEDLFEQVADKLGIGKTQVKELWKAGNAVWGFPTGRAKSKAKK